MSELAVELFARTRVDLDGQELTDSAPRKYARCLSFWLRRRKFRSDAKS